MCTFFYNPSILPCVSITDLRYLKFSDDSPFVLLVTTHSFQDVRIHHRQFSPISNLPIIGRQDIGRKLLTTFPFFGALRYKIVLPNVSQCGKLALRSQSGIGALKSFHAVFLIFSTRILALHPYLLLSN